MYPFERFTEQAKQALTLAQEEAERSHHSYIGTEHLVLGLLREGEGVAAKVLNTLGVKTSAVRSTIESVLGPNERIIIQQIIPTSRVKKVIEISFAEARKSGSDHVGTEHLLLGLLIEGEGIAAHVLEDLGANLEKVRAQIGRTTGGEMREIQADPTETPAAAGRVGVVDEVVSRAMAIAAERHATLGTEHFLLALAEQGSTTAGGILRRHRLSREAIEKILDNPPGRRRPAPGDDSPSA